MVYEFAFGFPKNSFDPCFLWGETGLICCIMCHLSYHFPDIQLCHNGCVMFKVNVGVVATPIFFVFTPKIGEDEPILTVRICFKGVGSSTN